MTGRGSSVVFILSFAAVPWGVEACGRAANVLEGNETVVPEGGTGGTAGSNTGGTGGSKASGGFRSSGGSGGIGTGGIFGPGGSPAGGSPSPGGAGGAGGGPSLPDGGDAYATARFVKANELCGIPEAHPCLRYSFSTGAAATSAERVQCVSNTNESQIGRLGESCWTEWSAHVACALQRSDYCPCGDGGEACTFDPWTEDFGEACLLTRIALDQCRMNNRPSGTEIGRAGAFDWRIAGDHDCQVFGAAPSGDQITTDCALGVDNYTHYCRCLINGVVLRNVSPIQPDVIISRTQCSQVALAIAGGECVDALDCCFYHESGVIGAPEKQCDCVDTSRTGNTCSELIGEPVDYCPQYRPAQ